MDTTSETPRSVTSGHRERLRQRFLENPSRLSETQRLELLLTFGIPRKDVAPLATALIERFGSLDGVLAANRDHLLCVKGIGDQAATLLTLIQTIRSHSTDMAERADKPPSPPSVVARLDAVQSQPTLATNSPDRDVRRDHERGAAEPAKPKPTIRRARTGLFSGCVFRDAVRLVAKIPLGSNVELARQFLQTQGLHYSGASTRHRYASYIVNRVFPGGEVDEALCRFARAFEGTQALRDIVAFRHMCAEPLTREIFVELLLPAIGRQNVPRAQLRKFLSLRFPDAKPNSINSCGKAIVEIINESQLVGATRTDLAVHFRPVDLRSFGFILHSEFPEPGMHRLDQMEGSAAFRAMLWTADDMKTALYELRNKGLISKISEIDSFRQFTTRFSLSQAVEKLIAIGGAR